MPPGKTHSRGDKGTASVLRGKERTPNSGHATFSLASRKKALLSSPCSREKKEKTTSALASLGGRGEEKKGGEQRPSWPLAL